MLRRSFPVLALAAAACGDSSDSAVPDAGAGVAPLAVAIPFDARFGATPFVCGAAMANVGVPPASYTPTDLRLYLSDIELLTEHGQSAPVRLDRNAYQGDRVALLDFENGCGSDGTAALHTTITGTVPGGVYRAIAFTLGVPAELDHLDIAGATAPLDVTGMYWTWLSGYKFLKLDGTVPAGAGAAPFFLHLGSSGCPGRNIGGPPAAPCAYPNRVRYVLPDYDPASRKVVVDLGAVLAAVDLAANTQDTAPGCMSEPGDPECIAVLPRIGINGAATPLLFRVE